MLKSGMSLRVGHQKGRYTVEIPWKGPILGDVVDRDGIPCLPLGGAANPALGDALVAVFVPVVINHQGTHFVAAPPGLREVAGALGVKCDENGWLQREIEASFLERGVEGVLMLLVYNEWKFDPHLPALSNESFAEVAMKIQDKVASAAGSKGGYPDYRPRLARSLTASDSETILAPLDELLQQQRCSDLRPALIEVRGRGR